MQFDDILYSADDGIARITINRPEVLNALRTQTYAELGKAFTAAAEDPTVGVIVLSGAGGRAFCVGGDVRSQLQRTPQTGRAHLRRMRELSAVMRGCGKPVIAAVDGYCIGGGNELQVFCDLTIATTRSRFGQSGPKVGSVPIWGSTQLLPLLVGEKRAREIIYLCRQYDAQQALAMGLINCVVPPEELAAEVDRWCQELLDKSPQGLRVAKISLNSISDSLGSSFEHGAELLATLYGSPENREGIQAFLDKRPPNYRRFRTGDEGK